MFALAIKLKPGVTAKHLESFINKWVPELQKSTRFGALSSLKLYTSAHSDTRMDEFVLMIDGFVEGPRTDALEELCDVVYSFDCDETGSWPESSA